MLDNQDPAEQIILEPSNAKYIAAFVGELNGNLKLLEKNLAVKIYQNGNKLSIQGESQQVLSAKKVIFDLYKTCCSGSDLSKEIIHLAINNISEDDPNEMSSVIKTPRRSIKARTMNQGLFIHNIEEHEINFAVGPAGTGKTYLAVAKAIEYLINKKVDKIVLIRPAVEAGEKLGFLPGDLSQKVDPYLKPLYDALHEMLGYDKTARLLEKDIIEVAPLAYLRGRTLNSAFVIMDEGQNTTIEQMKMFLTRMGFGSYAVINGDITQIDLAKHITSGLDHALTILSKIDGIGITYFKSIDVVRHPLVKKVIDAYSEHESKQS